MIQARVVLDSEGVLKAFQAEGHAGLGPAGADPLCAAFSVLARTAWECAESISDGHASGRAEAPGRLEFEIGPVNPAAAQRLRGMTEFLLTGLAGLERDFPGRISVDINEARRESHGA